MRFEPQKHISRQEFKKSFDSKYYSSFKSQISSLGFKSQFEKRTVTSIYFDTFNLDFYQESQEGLSPRKKIRIRWYDSEKFVSKLEVKETLSCSRRKFVRSLGKNEMEYMETVRANRTHSPPIIFPEFSTLLYPILQVSYEREYFIGNDSEQRCTLDSRINFKPLMLTRFMSNASRETTLSKDQNNVLELKTPDKPAKSDFWMVFKSQNSRYSKYCCGVEQLLNKTY